MLMNLVKVVSPLLLPMALETRTDLVDFKIFFRVEDSQLYSQVQTVQCTAMLET